MMENASPKPFYKKLKLSKSLDQPSEMLKSLHLLYVQKNEKSIKNEK